MGLFSRKKKIEVPAPPSEDLLKFPKASEVDDIKPETIKEAVGIEKPAPPALDFPPLPTKKTNLTQFEETPTAPPEPSFPLTPPERPSFVTRRPFFIRMQDYRLLLDNLNSIKSKTVELDETIEDLEKSGFNENRNYERLKNDLKKIHDRLLSMDDVIFKK